MGTLIDFREQDATERGKQPQPDAIPYDIQPDDALAAAIRETTDKLGGAK